MRIGNKLILSYTLIALLTFLITGVVLRSSIAFFYTENLTDQLTARANAFKVSIYELREGDLGSPRTQALIDKLSASTKTRITLINPDGIVVADSEAPNPGMMSNHKNIPEVKQALAGEVGKSKRFSNTIKQDVLYIATPLQDNGKVDGALRIALPMSDIDNALDKFSVIILIIAIGATILVIITSYFLSNSFTVPLNRMMMMAERMANDDLEQRLPVNSGDEIGKLSKSLNNLAVKLKGRIEELRSEKAKVDLILDNMAEGILLVGESGEVVLTNPSIERIFKVRSEDVIGNPVIHSIRNFDLDKAIQDSVASRREVVDEILLQSPFKQLRIRTMPITNSIGEEQTLIVIRDITRQKHVERLRKDFVANISHELKTPLTGLKLLSETLLRSIDDDPSSSRVFIKRLDKELSTLINMVRKLIDLSKLETTQDASEKEPVNLGELVSEVGSSFSQLAASKGLALNIGAPDRLPLFQGDKDQLLTLIRNLIDNAIRYTPSGGKIDVSIENEGNHVALSVSDNGIGLAKREIPRIFERFYRVDKARSRETGGTGLGLSIVKHIAENHQADIGVESSLGIGSKFTVRFPVNPRQP